MAYTKTPMQDTAQTKQVPLMFDWNSRDRTNSKDTDPVNVVWELIANQETSEGYYMAIKRNGITAFASPLPSVPYGTFYWEYGIMLISVGAFGIRGVSLSGVTLFTTPATFLPNVHIGFVNFAYDTGDNQLVITDGTNIYRVTVAGVVVAITDPDKPTPHVPYPVFLDGYLFLANSRGDVYNSANNNPDAWAAGEFLSAEAYPDSIKAIARSGIYIVVFGTSSIEFFYDAANPTGTPLAKFSGATPKIGFAGGLASQAESLFFVGLPSNGVINVYKLTGTRCEPIGGPTVSRQLSSIVSDSQFDFPGHVLLLNGMVLYTWTDASFSAATPSPCWAIDVGTGKWTQISTPLAVAPNPTGSWPAVTSTVATDVGGTFFYLGSGTQMYRFNSTAYQDAGQNFTASFTTRNHEYGTRRTKFGARLIIQADQTTTASLMNVSWSDDDYQTFSTPRPVDLAQKYTQLYALGSFRKRAFKFTYSDNFPMRWQGVELDYDQGAS